MTTTSNSTLRTYGLAYIPVIIWAAVIFIFSSQQTLPSLETSVFDFVFKKGAHMFVYAVLYLLLVRAVKKTVSHDSATYFWLPIVLVVAYAITDETHQQFVPGRYGTIRDIGFDVLGAGIVFLRQYRYI
ncbi:MAG: hypothetical protein QG639_499 [Patescibacteria group bacterium]|nr:hypothetical protein [Patescibacteria group bacterium]